MHRRVVIAVFPGIQGLDLVGPLEVFHAAQRFLGQTRQRTRGYEVRVVAASSELLRTESGLAVVPDGTFAGVRGAVDTLLIVGGAGARAASRDAAVAAWVRRVAPRCRRVASVCTGAFVLAAAGLLDGRRATTHWAHVERLRERYPRVQVEPDAVYVRDEHLWTSAGVTAGMDLALALVEDDVGRDVALAVARELVIFVRRAGGQSQFSAQLASQLAERQPLREVQAYIAEHPRADTRVSTLAARAGMSPRNFARAFALEVGVTPAVFVERARVETARRLLETTKLSVEEVAEQAGFGRVETLRRAFQRQLHVAPNEYRRRFA
ncbi:MAG: GlxA family transcriptional regulator [Polyangiales bacterium]|nr:GlxA family transcriptional regulator [Myxococcales bacterium]